MLYIFVVVAYLLYSTNIIAQRFRGAYNYIYCISFCHFTIFVKSLCFTNEELLCADYLWRFDDAIFIYTVFVVFSLTV